MKGFHRAQRGCVAFFRKRLLMGKRTLVFYRRCGVGEKTIQPQHCCENYCIPRLRRYLGMIQQERQNNIINILGGHSYAM